MLFRILKSTNMRTRPQLLDIDYNGKKPATRTSLAPPMITRHRASSASSRRTSTESTQRQPLRVRGFSTSGPSTSKTSIPNSIANSPNILVPTYSLKKKKRTSSIGASSTSISSNKKLPNSPKKLTSSITEVRFHFCFK